MTPTRSRLAGRVIPLALVAIALGALSGCISVLPKAAPAQLYRFGADWPSAASASSPSGPDARVAVLLDGPSFPRAAIGDAMLTTRGSEVAYIAGARWASPAVLMFNEAVQRAFDARAVRTRLTGRGELGRVQAVLRLEGREFQAEYAPGLGAPGSGGPPTVVVSLRARLTRPDGGVLAEQDFTARRAAAADRVSAIVPAFDAASVEVLTGVVAWTDAHAPAAPR